MIQNVGFIILHLILNECPIFFNRSLNPLGHRIQNVEIMI
jgi:hypothetical protein